MTHARLPAVLAAWGSDDFNAVCRREIAALGDALPLQAGLRRGAYALSGTPEVMLQAVETHPDRLRLRVGLFYSSLTPGCSCADDPTPLDEEREYCRLQLDITRPDGEVSARLLDEDA